MGRDLGGFLIFVVAMVWLILAFRLDWIEGLAVVGASATVLVAHGVSHHGRD